MTAFKRSLNYSVSYFFFFVAFFLAFFLAFFFVTFFFATFFLAFFFATFFFAILSTSMKKHSYMRTHPLSPVIVCILIAWHTSCNKILKRFEKYFDFVNVRGGTPKSFKKYNISFLQDTGAIFLFSCTFPNQAVAVI